MNDDNTKAYVITEQKEYPFVGNLPKEPVETCLKKLFSRSWQPLPNELHEKLLKMKETKVTSVADMKEFENFLESSQEKNKKSELVIIGFNTEEEIKRSL